MKPGHWVAIAVAFLSAIGIIVAALVQADSERDSTSARQTSDASALGTEAAAAYNRLGTVIAATATREVWLTARAPTPTDTPIPPSPTDVPTPFPGPISALHASDPSVELCPKARRPASSDLPCWYLNAQGLDWEDLAYQVYDTDVGTGATLIRNHNRDDVGRYLYPYTYSVAAVYIPRLSAPEQRIYQLCAPDRSRRRYPCVYEVQDGDNSYRGIAQSIYGDPDRADALLDANQYYDSVKHQWFKRELKEGVFLVMLHFP